MHKLCNIPENFFCLTNYEQKVLLHGIKRLRNENSGYSIIQGRKARYSTYLQKFKKNNPCMLKNLMISKHSEKWGELLKI